MPTAVSLAEIVALGLPVKIIASGGIRTAVDAAKALCMGAALVGMAGPLVKHYVQKGSDSLSTFMEQWLYRLKAIFLMTSSPDLAAIHEKPLIILGHTRAWLEARHIDCDLWSRR